MPAGGGTTGNSTDAAAREWLWFTKRQTADVYTFHLQQGT